MNNPQLICVCGATATGKTDVAFELAQKLNTEIISIDSLQVYKYFDIGTAKPSLEMRKKIPHHLIDCVDPTESFTAGDFKRQAEEIISRLAATKKHVILVGGTGFYLQALLQGMYEIPAVSNEVKEAVVAEFNKRGAQSLYDELKKLDPEHAQKIHVNDTYRIMRAFEVMRSGKLNVTEIKKQFKTKPPPYPVLLVGLKRVKSRLKEQIVQRTNTMITEGLIEETRTLLKKYPQGLKALESVGYIETQSYLNGEIDVNSLKAAIVKSTVLLAKRQTTWFKRDPKIQWFDPDEYTSLDTLAEKVLTYLR